jgi:hypothetical protein
MSFAHGRSVQGRLTGFLILFAAIWTVGCHDRMDPRLDSDAAVGTDATGSDGTDSGEQMALDPSGAHQFFPSAPSGPAAFYFGVGNWEQRFEKGAIFEDRPIGTYTGSGVNQELNITESRVRVRIYSVDGPTYTDTAIPTFDSDVLTQQGYMQTPNDWRNYEFTVYVKRNDGDSSSGLPFMRLYGRGGEHGSEPCMGTSYKASFNLNGTTDFQKEQHHPNGYSGGQDKRETFTAPDGKWVGVKYALYNFERERRTLVKMESYVDEGMPNTEHPGNLWRKVDEYIDDGKGSKGADCSGSPNHIITHGGPIAMFRFNHESGTSTDVKWISVREIVPPTVP